MKHIIAWRSIETGIRAHSGPVFFNISWILLPFPPEELLSFLVAIHEHAAFSNEQVLQQAATGPLMEAERLGLSIALTNPEFSQSNIWLEEAIP